ncbi:MAG: flagellar hook-associated protein FlgK [Thermanaerothrix sp.]|uniref:flagellar hook-associated protein FlgK n=1 Tax=Thermanaerothrix sp. TaxID=2972675 RepID=UPI003C7E3808
MSTLFSNLSIALSALLSHQRAIEVIEHNVANANTPGYRRQEAVLSAATPTSPNLFKFGGGSGQVGSGVQVDMIRRYSLDFFDRRYRSEVARAKTWETRSEILKQAEIALGETSENSLLTQLDAFWSGWLRLSSDPTNTALRADLLESTRNLAEAFQRRINRLETLRADQETALQQKVDEINTLASRLAKLNQEITRIYSVGDQPNDLLDERDRVLDRLAELSGAISYRRENGEVTVSIGGHVLVFGPTPYRLTLDPTTKTPVWEDGQPYNATDGEIQGILSARDGDIQALISGLNALATDLIDFVNTIHANAYGLDNQTGRPLFIGQDARTIALNPAISSPIMIAAASRPDAPGDNSAALKIAQGYALLRMSNNSATYTQFYTTQIASLGAAVQAAQSRSKDYATVANALNTQRESISGVSLDEEAANLVRFQRAFQAAARLMNVADEMLDRIINGLGHAGR